MSSVSSTSGVDYGNVVFTDYADNSILDPSSFLTLLVAELTNQDFTDPYDTGEMIATMAQFTQMQIIQEMGEHSTANYAMSLVGKTVTASRFTVSGDLDTTTGNVDKVSIVDNEYVIYVGGKTYQLNQIMSISDGVSGTVSSESQDITVHNIKALSAELNWTVPTEDSTLAPDLQYTVYYSTDSSMDTVAQVKENGTLSGVANQKNITDAIIVGLEPDTTYYANIIVTSTDGSEYIFKTAEFTTLIG